MKLCMEFFKFFNSKRNLSKNLHFPLLVELCQFLSSFWFELAILFDGFVRHQTNSSKMTKNKQTVNFKSHTYFKFDNEIEGKGYKGL